MNQITVTGNTYPVREQLKALGGQWDATNKRWNFPQASRAALEAIDVPVGGREELWEECDKCGAEPVDSSGLCARCRGTSKLTITGLKSPDEEATDLLEDIDGVTLSLYKSASRGAEVQLPVETHEVGSGSPFGGGYHVKLLTDGSSLYAQYIHHYEGDRNRAYVVDTTNYKLSYQMAVSRLIARSS
jgi:hypothetical protein